MRHLFLLPATLLALVGCAEEESAGTSTESPGAAPASSEPLGLEGAADRTTAAETARIALEGSVDLEGLEPIDFIAAGAADFTAGTSRVALDMSEFSEVSAEYGPARNWRGEAYYDAAAIYIRLPAVSISLPEAKEWVKIDAERLQQQGGAQFSAPDPAQFLHFAEAVGVDAEEAGEEQIRDVDTTRYRASVDVDDLSQGLDAYARRLKFAGIETIPIEVWVDGEGMIRRLSAKYDNMETGTNEADVTFAMELYDLGEKIDLRPPAPDQVSDIDDLIGRGAEANEEAEVFP